MPQTALSSRFRSTDGDVASSLFFIFASNNKKGDEVVKEQQHREKDRVTCGRRRPPRHFLEGEGVRQSKSVP